MKLLRTIRLDPSDTFIFERAAEPGEWAVPGGFVFFDADPAALEGKARIAFRSGFLGIASLGFSTLVQIVAASEADVANAIAYLWTRWGGSNAAGSDWSRVSSRPISQRRASPLPRSSPLRRR
jgi:hypothetical protein